MTATISASVAGSWINGAAVVTRGANHQVINPATGDVVAELALATPGDVDELMRRYESLSTEDRYRRFFSMARPQRRR